MHTVTRTTVSDPVSPPRVPPVWAERRAALDLAAAERGLPPEPWPA